MDDEHDAWHTGPWYHPRTGIQPIPFFVRPSNASHFFPTMGGGRQTIPTTIDLDRITRNIEDLESRLASYDAQASLTDAERSEERWHLKAALNIISNACEMAEEAHHAWVAGTDQPWVEEDHIEDNEKEVVSLKPVPGVQRTEQDTDIGTALTELAEAVKRYREAVERTGDSTHCDVQKGMNDIREGAASVRRAFDHYALETV